MARWFTSLNNYFRGIVNVNVSNRVVVQMPKIRTHTDSAKITDYLKHQC